MVRLLVALALAIGPFAASDLLAGKYNDVLSVGDAAPAFEDLPGTDGDKHSLAEFGQKVVVVVFTCNSCPVARDYEDRLIAFAKAHADDVAVVAINVNKVPEDGFEKMKQRAEEKQYPFPYLYDETQQVARKFGAYATPEFYVLSRERKIVYMGAMDDSSVLSKVEKQFVEPAVAAALADKAPETTETYAHGCKIRYDRARREE